MGLLYDDIVFFHKADTNGLRIIQLYYNFFCNSCYFHLAITAVYNAGKCARITKNKSGVARNTQKCICTLLVHSHCSFSSYNRHQLTVLSSAKQETMSAITFLAQRSIM